MLLATRNNVWAHLVMKLSVNGNKLKSKSKLRVDCLDVHREYFIGDGNPAMEFNKFNWWIDIQLKWKRN